MNEILILSGISGIIFIFVKNKFTKYEKEILNISTEKEKFYSEKISLQKEIKELNQKLPKELTDEQQESIKEWGMKYERFISKFYQQKGYIVEHIGTKENELTDEKIDIIAKNDYETLLIECKYWTNKRLEYKNINEIYGKYNFYINENNLDRKNTNCIIVFPKLDNLSKRAKFLLDKNKDICRYEIVPAIINKDKEMMEYKLILGIIEDKNKCYKCNKDTKVIALLFYNNYDFIKIDDITVKYNLQKLPKNMLELIQKKYPKYMNRTQTKSALPYIANHCEHCGSVQGDTYLFDNTNGTFYNIYKEPKYFIGLNEETDKLEYVSEFFS
ncbi:restriction endonuclease [Aliarcobacter butzleri]|uniref:restriction endonuclease n=1 Tax=Aliarcobacter butzleri TaxID=28197 RepID=UPI001EDC11A3|nr:restriction endonuclease [Aliarcobacter butzleri]MCG3667472.1 restriction endonuclease [Aliarcobacter butzleri]MDN5112923.1 restriction endonuclease [Aliarcobacter butzleri]